jgi:hypothetical protein
MNDSVHALAVSGTDLYAGGYFTHATNAGPSAVNVNYIAKWNGSTWSALGSGMGVGDYPHVSALAVWGTDLYAGGSFTYATNAGPSAVKVNNIAKWNGSAWAPLGSGMDLYVYALAVSGPDLYAGGYFTTAGGSPANCIARWNGSDWSPLGSGLNSGGVYTLAVSGGDLYAGGWFTTAGNKAYRFVARAAIVPGGLDLGLRAYDGTRIIRIACEAPGPGGTLSSPLRIARNGTNYGILLVQTNATDASRIQVKTPAGIKAWKKLP